MFGKVRETPQNEMTPFHPRSPYGISKVAGFELTRNYREAYGMYLLAAAFFLITRVLVADLSLSREKYSRRCPDQDWDSQRELRIGNLEARRDWGHAKDYVPAMYLMFQQDEPDDYVVAMGETHSVREFCDAAFSHVGLNYRTTFSEDPQFYRPAEVDLLIGDASKAKTKLGWQPTYTFESLVKEMVDSDLESLREARAP